VWRRLLENSLSAKVSCWLIRLLILGSGYNTMISHLGLIRTFLRPLHNKYANGGNFSSKASSYRLFASFFTPLNHPNLGIMLEIIKYKTRMGLASKTGIQPHVVFTQ
ncbi:hypothetical protein, partial [Providencia rustigianii]|uniref:hypothetical protein n=1 Tax=Providencia rustigianii TaxID=158850 RepID=UPI00223FDF8E